MQTVFISGAATGIGAGLVTRLVREGWLVFAGYRNSLPEAASWFGAAQVVPIKCDITSVPGIVKKTQPNSGPRSLKIYARNTREIFSTPKA